MKLAFVDRDLLVKPLLTAANTQHQHELTFLEARRDRDEELVKPSD